MLHIGNKNFTPSNLSIEALNHHEKMTILKIWEIYLNIYIYRNKPYKCNFYRFIFLYILFCIFFYFVFIYFCFILFILFLFFSHIYTVIKEKPNKQIKPIFPWNGQKLLAWSLTLQFMHFFTVVFPHMAHLDFFSSVPTRWFDP